MDLKNCINIYVMLFFRWKEVMFYKLWKNNIRDIFIGKCINDK